MKKLLTIVLAITMIMSAMLFTSCGEKAAADTANADDKALQGTWTGKMTMPGELVEALIFADPEARKAYGNAKFDDVTINVEYTFDDGEFEVKADEDASDKIVDVIVDGMWDAYGNQLMQVFPTKSDFKQAQLEEAGEMDLISEEGDYKFKNGKLKVGNGLYEYKFSNDNETLKLTPDRDALEDHEAFEELIEMGYDEDEAIDLLEDMFSLKLKKD